MKKRTTLIAAIYFAMISCAPQQSQDTAAETDSTAQQSPGPVADAGMVVPVNDTLFSGSYEEGDYYSNIINPMTISAETKLYEKADTNSKVLGILPFGTPLRAGRGPRQEKVITQTRKHPDGTPYTYTQYRLLQWYNAALPESKGYVKATDVASHSYADTTRGIDYFVVTDGSPAYNHDGATVCIYDRNRQTLIDSLRIRHWVNVVKFFDDLPWSNVNMLIRVSKISAECGGYGGTFLIADVNGKLTEIITSGYTNAEGLEESSSSEVLLPVKTPKGELVMALNGDITYGSPLYFKDIVNFPANMSSHQEELVIKVIRHARPVLNAQQEPVLDSAGNNQWKETHQEEFYRWNGSKLARVK